MSESKLRSVYSGFKSITAELENKTVNPEFWKKERENIIKIVKESRKWKESTKPTPESLNKVFGRLKGE
jgi:hypothetical protein